ncbi:hypothetical protein [Turicimonas muris]|uniref:hypothetical protein n=1 Tax=Turicimonas muris TaxID=1796652 RepID=UPI002494E33A|nr:hypothetical protein [Turicimonas muris]
MENESQLLSRLANWRRVYGDKSGRMISPTYVFCRYAEAFIDRMKETEEEKRQREEDELRYRELPQPAPDYDDAELLQEVWSRVPDWIEGIPVKKNIKIFVFGTARELEKRAYKAGASRGEDFVRWRDEFIRIFFERVEREEELRKEFGGVVGR